MKKAVVYTAILTFVLSLTACPNPLINAVIQPKTVTFETNGGSQIGSQTVYKDYPIKRPSTPTKAGFSFDAWCVDNEPPLQEWDFNVAPNRDITLYAKWIYQIITNPADFEALLTALPPNTPSTPYTVTLNVSDLSGIAAILRSQSNSGKYVNLDFSGSSFTSVPDHGFQGNGNTTGITLPPVVTSIGDFAFERCTLLTSINIPAGVTSIGQSAFDFCISLTEITISASVESIGNGAFNACFELKTVTFAPGSRLETINDYAFSICLSLTSITIPGSVTSVGYGAFGDCESRTAYLTGGGAGTYTRADTNATAWSK